MHMQTILLNIRLRLRLRRGRYSRAVDLLLLLGRKHLLPLIEVELPGEVLRRRRGRVLLWVHGYGHGHHEDGERAGAVAAGCLDARAYEEREV